MRERETERERAMGEYLLLLEVSNSSCRTWWCGGEVVCELVSEVGECGGGGGASRQPSANPRSDGYVGGVCGTATNLMLRATGPHLSL